MKWKLTLLTLFLIVALASQCYAAIYHLPPNTIIRNGQKVHFGTYWISTSGTDIHITVWFESDWCNYTVGGSGSQQIYNGSKPTSVYTNGLSKTEGDGWSYYAGTVTVTAATSNVALKWGAGGGASAVLVTVISPTNTTHTSASVPLEISATGGTIDRIWWNCKNETSWIYGSNQTYTTPTSMTGFVNGTSYTFYGWANNTEAQSDEETVGFSVQILIANWYHFGFSFYDLDNLDVENKVTWHLLTGIEVLTYVEGEATLEAGTYTLKTYYHVSLINQTILDTATYGNTTVNVYLQFKAYAYGYLAFNNAVTGLVLHNQSMYNLAFTVYGSVPTTMTIDFPNNPTYIYQAGVEQTGWTYTNGYVVLTATSLSIWQIIYETSVTPPIETPPLPVPPVTVTQTLYMRSDTHTVDNQLGYVLWTSQTFTYTNVVLSKADPAGTAHWGWRFWIVYKDNSTQELTSGTAVAQVSRSSDGSGLQSATYTPDKTSFGLMHMTVALKANLYIWFGSDTPMLKATFISNNFLARAILNSTWTVYTYTYRDTYLGLTTARFYWGTTAYNSRIASFSIHQPYSWEAMYENLGNKDLVGFFLVPGLYYFGPLFYGIVMAMASFMLYMRGKSFAPLLILLILLGGVGGALLKPLIPSVGFEWGWALVMLGVAGLFYKLVHGASHG